MPDTVEVAPHTPSAEVCRYCGLSDPNVRYFEQWKLWGHYGPEECIKFLKAEVARRGEILEEHERYFHSRVRPDEMVREAVEGMDRSTLCGLCDDLSGLWLEHDWREQEAKAFLLAALTGDAR